MKITITRAELEKIGRLKSICNHKTVLSITEFVRIENIGNNSLKVSATNTETSYVGFISATVDRPGCIVINCQKLNGLVKNMASDEMVISENRREISIQSGAASYIMYGRDPEEFPELPIFDIENGYEINSSELLGMISSTCGVINEDDRAHIQGVLIENHATGLRFVSTDGSRLVKRDHGACGKQINGVLVPKKQMQTLSRTLLPGDVFINFSDNFIGVKNGDETIIIRLLEGQFPQYDNMLKYRSKTPLTIDRDALNGLFTRGKVFLQSGSDASHLKCGIITIENNSFILKIENENGISKETLVIDSNINFKAGFNVFFLAHAIGLTSSPEIHLQDEKSPAIIVDRSIEIAVMPAQM